MSRAELGKTFPGSNMSRAEFRQSFPSPNMSRGDSARLSQVQTGHAWNPARLSQVQTCPARTWESFSQGQTCPARTSERVPGVHACPAWTWEKSFPGSKRLMHGVAAARSASPAPKQNHLPDYLGTKGWRRCNQDRPFRFECSGQAPGARDGKRGVIISPHARHACDGIGKNHSLPS
jgi:hypothetical protein